MPLTWNLKGWLRAQRRLKDPIEIRDYIQRRTGYRIQLRSVNKLLTDKPELLDIRTLQAICDAFQCRLTAFCDISPRSTTNSSAALTLAPCTITSDDGLDSFIARVQTAAIHEAIAITGSKTSAAKRLGYQRTSLLDLYARLTRHKTAGSSNRNSLRRQNAHTSVNPITFSRDLFIIKPNETLQSFIDRIKLAAITETLALERTYGSAALRLGYSRTSLHTLLRKLRARRATNQQKKKRTAAK